MKRFSLFGDSLNYITSHFDDQGSYSAQLWSSSALFRCLKLSWWTRFYLMCCNGSHPRMAIYQMKTSRLCSFLVLLDVCVKDEKWPWDDHVMLTWPLFCLVGMHGFRLLGDLVYSVFSDLITLCGPRKMYMVLNAYNVESNVLLMYEILWLTFMLVSFILYLEILYHLSVSSSMTGH